MRRNTPALIDPSRATSAVVDRSLGAPSAADTADRLDQLERRIYELTRVVERSQSKPLTSIHSLLSFASPGILTTFALKGSVTATNITTPTTVTNSNLGPLIAGTRYLVIAIAQMGMNAPAGQTIYAAVRIEASGTTVDGIQTQITAGERDGMAIDFKEITGTGASINIAGRARVTSGTGTVTDCISVGIAIPLGAMIEV